MANTRAILVRLSENDFRIKVLIPLLRALGCIKVDDWQGNQENGKDLYFAYRDVFGRIQHCCAFIKRGELVKGTRRPGKTDIRTYASQLSEAFETDFANPFDNSVQIRPGSVYIICNGTVNPAAQQYIHFNLARKYPGRLHYFDVDHIADFIDNDLPKKSGWPRGYAFNTHTFLQACDQVSSPEPAPAVSQGITGVLEGTTL